MNLHQNTSIMNLKCSYCICCFEVDSGRLGTGLVVWVSLRFKEWVNSVIINGITEMNYRCNYMQVFKTYKYIVKTYMYTISALYTVKKIKS